LAKQGKREVSSQDGKALQSKLDSMNYLEGSAKEGIEIDTIFTEMTLGILKASGKI